jgi:hypothetical protein
MKEKVEEVGKALIKLGVGATLVVDGSGILKLVFAALCTLAFCLLYILA